MDNWGNAEKPFQKIVQLFRKLVHRNSVHRSIENRSLLPTAAEGFKAKTMEYPRQRVVLLWKNQRSSFFAAIDHIRDNPLIFSQFGPDNPDDVSNYIGQNNV